VDGEALQRCGRHHRDDRRNSNTPSIFVILLVKAPWGSIGFTMERNGSGLIAFARLRED
jgi:hypothetical protein